MTSSKEPWNSHFWVDASDLREPRRGFFECYNGISAARSLIAICLICYQTTFVHFLVWPPLDSFAAFFSLTSYLFVIFQALRFNFEAASLGPGFVPFKWMAERRNDVRGRLQFCKICGGFKPPRAHHCRKCGRCVLKMDHHCPWIDACMGHRNLVVFLKFLVFAIAGAVYSSVVLSKVFLDSEIEMGDYHKLLTACTLGFAASVAVLVTYLLQKLLRSVATNRTEIERYIEQKTEAYPREDKKAFVWPYDLGFARNVTTTLFETTGNGFFFRVVEGTDQFTLSKEQMRQKEVKRISAHKVKVVSDLKDFSVEFAEIYDRLWLSEGVVKAEQGEFWIISRVTDHHLYGYKEDEETTKGWILSKACKFVE